MWGVMSSPGVGRRPRPGRCITWNKILLSPMSDESEATAMTLSSQWGTNDPGLDMTGVHLRVLGGALCSRWPSTN